MTMKPNVEILFLGQLVFCVLVVGKQCYNCSLTEHCNDEFMDNNLTKGYLINCTGSCVKHDDQYHNIVHRFCSPMIQTTGCKKQSFNGNSGWACSCLDNACNDAELAHLAHLSILNGLVLTTASVVLNMIF